MKDKQGRKYARLDRLKPGDRVMVDGGFTCMEPWSRHRAHVDPVDKRLYIFCRSGQHYLDGQLNRQGVSLVGVYKA